LFVVGFALVAAALLATPAYAAFVSATGSSSNSLGADTLDPPTAVASSRTGGVNTVTWTASVDSYADGYDLYRSTSPSSGFSLLTTVAGGSTVSYDDDVCAGGGCGADYAETGGTFVGNANSASLSVPAGTQSGDLLLAFVSVAYQFPRVNPAPSGWTMIAEAHSSANGHMFYRVADGTEPASYTFTWGDSRNAQAVMMRYTGIDTSSPIGASSFDSSSFPHPSAPSVTTTVDDSIVVRFLSQTDNPSAIPSGTTQRFNNFNTILLSVVDSVQASAGSTGTATWTNSNYGSWVAMTVVLQPDSGGGATYYYRLQTTASNWRSIDSNTSAGS
jgi:hypothetical protein